MVNGGFYTVRTSSYYAVLLFYRAVKIAFGS